METLQVDWNEKNIIEMGSLEHQKRIIGMGHISHCSYFQMLEGGSG